MNALGAAVDRLVKEGVDPELAKAAVFGLIGRVAGMAARGLGAARGTVVGAARAGAARTGGFFSSIPTRVRAGMAGRSFRSQDLVETARAGEIGRMRTGVQAMYRQRMGAPVAKRIQAAPVVRPSAAPAAPARPNLVQSIFARPTAPAAARPAAAAKGRKKKRSGFAGDMAATMAAGAVMPGDSGPQEKTQGDAMKHLIEKIAAEFPSATEAERLELLASAAAHEGFLAELKTAAEAAGYSTVKTAAEDEKAEDEKEEKSEGKDEEKKEEKSEKKDDSKSEKKLPPWLQKKDEKGEKSEKGEEKKDEDEKKSSAPGVSYNKFTARDIASHLAAQFGRPETYEKEAAHRPALAKLAKLVEAELGRPS